MLAKINRITSIDLMRGLTLFLMLFVNDLYVPGVPKWLVHKTIEEGGLNLNILWYKQSEMPWLAVSGSLLWAFIMIRFAQLLSKARIRLKL